MDFAQAIAAIPEDHFGLLIGFVAVSGGLFVSGILGGIAIWRGITLQGKMTEIRAQLVTQMLQAGLSSREILAVLDHPSMSCTTPAQRKRTREVLKALSGMPTKPAKPAKLGV